jgi:hypothetical protein
MNKWELEFFIGCTTAAVIVLGVVTMIYFGASSNNERYYDSMNKCIAAGGSFIPQNGSGSVCLMGMKQ